MVNYVKVEGTWRTISSAHIKIENSWRAINDFYTKNNGSWSASPSNVPDAPIISYRSFGQFNIINFDSTLVYETSIVTGGGTASIAQSGPSGWFILSDTNARFSVTAKYSNASVTSDPAYMERKAYTYSCRQEPYQCCNSCNCVPACTNCGGTAPGACGNCPNAECGCNNAGFPGWCGCVEIQCQQCCSTCYNTICDILIDQPGYTNSGSEWYRLS